MADRVLVREAVEADLPATARIIATEGEGTEAEWLARFADVLADPTRLFLVAEVGGRVVGFGQAGWCSDLCRPLKAHPPTAGTCPASRWQVSTVALA